MRALRCLVSTHHKDVAKLFLWSGLLFLLLGGLLAMVMRWQWAHPGEPVPLVGTFLYPETNGAVNPEAYTELFTNHGLIMIFFAITPILIGALGNLVIPLLIGARDMAFPRLNLLSFWALAAAQLLALASLASPQAASSGWTMYAPLASGEGAPGAGQTLMMLAIAFSGVSSVLGAVNYVTTVVMLRSPGEGWVELPLTVWGLFLTAILNALFVPVLAIAALLLLSDRVLGSEFFAPAIGDPVLYQHLFWIFGHPEVYILILPVWGLLADLFSHFSGVEAAGRRSTIGAMVMVTVMSGLVYGHHLYQSGMGPMLGAAFEALTLAISAPSVVLVLNWLLTLWRGRPRFTAPMLFALGTLLVFVLGGLTGIGLGAISSDIYLHDSLWVVGHFHLIMAAASLLGSFAAIHYWFPAFFGRRMNEPLGQVHALGTLVFSLLTFGSLLVAGYAGQSRRLYDPFHFEFLENLRGLNQWTTVFAFALGAWQLLFLVNLVWSLRSGPVAGSNPWQLPESLSRDMEAPS